MKNTVSAEYVNEMRRLATLSGRISEFHDKNMRLYCRIVFENFQDAAIEYQIPIYKETNGWVKYKVNTVKKKNAGNRARSVKKRAEDLARWTRDLLWRDMEVSVFINDKEVKLEQPQKPTDSDASASAGES
jgi:hypothetical protein